MSPAELRIVVNRAVRQIGEEDQLKLQDPVPDNMPISQCGLDSFAFATLVMMLENELGYDPFMLMDEPFYPSIFGEFIAIYLKFIEHARN